MNKEDEIEIIRVFVPQEFSAEMLNYIFGTEHGFFIFKEMTKEEYQKQFGKINE